MLVDQDFLRKVQRCGWQLHRVDQAEVVGKCPVAGCGLKVKVDAGGFVPSCHRADPALTDIPIESFDDLRHVLRARREDLALTITEVEEVAGLTVDYLAKFEKDDPSKIPNMQATLEWLQALGYQMVIRPAQLTPYALRVLVETREKAPARHRRFELERERRSQRQDPERR